MTTVVRHKQQNEFIGNLKLLNCKSRLIFWSGKLQHSHARITAKPNVIYEKGGCDFRTPHNTSSFGKQVVGAKHTSTASRISIGHAPRFTKSETCGPGPNMAQPSSFQRQISSNRKTSEVSHFGTSVRADALKQYAIYTAKK